MIILIFIGLIVWGVSKVGDSNDIQREIHGISKETMKARKQLRKLS